MTNPLNYKKLCPIREVVGFKCHVLDESIIFLLGIQIRSIFVHVTYVSMVSLFSFFHILLFSFGFMYFSVFLFHLCFSGAFDYRQHWLRSKRFVKGKYHANLLSFQNQKMFVCQQKQRNNCQVCYKFSPQCNETVY